VLDRSCGARTIVADSARVALGSLADAELESYASGGAWRGKAGGYNFADRVEAGWPLSCDGDPETVMGLPSRILLPLLRGEAGPR
jgi:predicted house-cleaning NTP pyrophosphatase (Maf/HAM1 superfamily)